MLSCCKRHQPYRTLHENIVIDGIYTDLGGVGSGYGVGRKDKLNSVVNS